MVFKRSLAAFCAVGFCAQSAFAQDSSVLCIQCNNEGVKALSNGEFSAAISKLEECRRLYPNYKLGSKNLSLAYNNYAISLSLDNPTEALKNFQKASALDNNPVIQQNIKDLIARINREVQGSRQQSAQAGQVGAANTDDLRVRIERAEKQLASGDGASACTEALAVLNSPSIPDSIMSRAVLVAHFGFLRSGKAAEADSILVQSKKRCNHNVWPYPIIACLLGEISEQQMMDRVNSDRANEVEARNFLGYRDLLAGRPQLASVHFEWVERNASEFRKQIAFEELKRLDPSHVLIVVDYKDYIAKLQDKLRSHWHPPDVVDQSRKVHVVFKVHTDGKISHCAISKTSGSSSLDAAGLKALEAASPVDPLPKGSPDDVDVDFFFECNAIKGP